MSKSVVLSQTSLSAKSFDLLVSNQNNSKNATGELIVNGGTVTTNNTMIGHKNNQIDWPIQREEYAVTIAEI